MKVLAKQVASASDGGCGLRIDEIVGRRAGIASEQETPSFKMLNQIILEGNLGADAEMRQVSSELFAIQFSLAQTQEARNEKRTMWLRCDLLRNNAESATKTVAVLKKGRRVVVVGQLLDDSYEKSGEKIKALKVRVEKFHLMDAPSEANQAQGQASSQVAKQTQATQATQAVIANDLPF